MLVFSHQINPYLPPPQFRLLTTAGTFSQIIYNFLTSKRHLPIEKSHGSQRSQFSVRIYGNGLTVTVVGVAAASKLNFSEWHNFPLVMWAAGKMAGRSGKIQFSIFVNFLLF